MSSLMYKTTNAAVSALYRVSGGRLGASFGSAPVLLLTTKGRKSGKKRTAPLLYGTDGDDLVLIASKGGSPTHPAWFLNLKANPDVEVQVGRSHERRRARVAEGEERERLWGHMAGMYANYDSYKDKTEREIPVVVLEKPGKGTGAPEGAPATGD
jgi:deazaflavin-dependent oxidoreductase (nitroreductase family)